MRFIVSRTSSWNHEKNPPCDGAEWRGDCWTMKIESLEQLIDFTATVDSRVIINRANTFDDLPTIEIYDDYRE